MGIYKGQDKILSSITAVEEAKVKAIAKEEVNAILTKKVVTLTPTSSLVVYGRFVQLICSGLYDEDILIPDEYKPEEIPRGTLIASTDGTNRVLGHFEIPLKGNGVNNVTVYVHVNGGESLLNPSSSSALFGSTCWII